MNTIKLNICDFEISPQQRVSPSVNELPAWIEALPTGDPATTAAHLFNLLHRYNQSEIEADIRFSVLESLEAVIDNTTLLLCEKYSNSALPLSERNRQRFHLSCGLLDQLAIGYKIIVLNLNSVTSKPQSTHNLFLKSIHKAVTHLARLLLECYTVYAIEPNDIWGELHQLYRLAESLGANRVALNQIDSQNPATQTIEYNYVRIALLSAANPYHLLPGEVTILYDYLKQWAMNCSLDKIDKSGNASCNSLVVDFNGESPPNFQFEEKIIDSTHYRAIDINDLPKQFNDTLSKMTSYLKSNSAHTTLNERMRRDMLLRIQRIWKQRQIRKQQRDQTHEYIILAMGLEISHHFVGNEQKFAPEQREISFYQTDFVPLARVSQKSVETQIHNIERYDKDLTKWCSIFGSDSKQVMSHNSISKQYRTFRWMLTNQSEHGIGLRRDGFCEECVQVGDIITYKRSNFITGWQIGVVRWLKELDKHVLELGVNILRGVPSAVAVRAAGSKLIGPDRKSTYFRCFLLELHTRGQSYISLLTPASIFDVDSQILINSNTQLKYAQLTELVASTNSYAQFEFKFIDTPLPEQEKIERINQF